MPGANVEHLPLDLASFASVRAFADTFTSRFDHLDVLVNNAGLTVSKRTVTEDGHETQFQVNHLSHFLLTRLLHDQLAAAPAARVVNVSSTGHTFARDGLDFDDLDWERRRYRGFLVYCATKLANVLFTRELARRLDDTKITANAVHPGFVGSNFAREGDMGLAIGLDHARRAAVRDLEREGRAHVGVPRELTRRRRHHRPVLLPVQGREALERRARRRGRGPPVGRERGDDRPQLSSATSGPSASGGDVLGIGSPPGKSSRHAITATTSPSPRVIIDPSAATILASAPEWTKFANDPPLGS